MGISDKIIANAKITLDAMKLISIGNLDLTEIPESFGFKKINQ
jgi:hypothetical protein